jgi:transcription antitermination factor NusA-like protein
MLRIPGVLSKILVEGKRGLVDPSGACIGRGGERIKNISRLIEPERINVGP